MCGAVISILPEELSGDSSVPHSKEKADVYSFRFLIYEFLTPSTHTQHQFYQKVINDCYCLKFKYHLSNELESLTKRWYENIDDRPTFEEIFGLLLYEKYFLPDVNPDKLEEYFEELNNR